MDSCLRVFLLINDDNKEHFNNKGISVYGEETLQVGPLCLSAGVSSIFKFLKIEVLRVQQYNESDQSTGSCWNLSLYNCTVQCL